MNCVNLMIIGPSFLEFIKITIIHFIQNLFLFYNFLVVTLSKTKNIKTIK